MEDGRVGMKVKTVASQTERGQVSNSAVIVIYEVVLHRVTQHTDPKPWGLDYTQSLGFFLFFYFMHQTDNVTTAEWNNLKQCL